MDFSVHNMDITTVANYEFLCSAIRTGGVDGSQVNLVLSCVDNFGARIAINRVRTTYNMLAMVVIDIILTCAGLP